MLAHQGGWDEMLLVLGPMIVIGGLLAIARRVASSGRPAQAPPTDGADGTDPGAVRSDGARPDA